MLLWFDQTIYQLICLKNIFGNGKIKDWKSLGRFNLLCDQSPWENLKIFEMDLDIGPLKSR